MSKPTQQGFTLIELMVAIAVLAIMLAIGLPSFQGSLRSNRVATSTNDMLAALSLARTEAIRNTRGSAVCASADGLACDGEWDQGWLVFSDTDRNGALNAGEVILRYTAVDEQLDVGGPDADVLRFDARGRLHADLGGQQVLTIASSPCPAGEMLVRAFTITPTGQVRTDREACE